MAEATCPSPFCAAGSLAASSQMEVACPDNRDPTVVTWNPADKNVNIVLSEGDLRADNAENLEAGVRATSSKASGKWCWEVKVLAAGSGVCIGIGASGSPLDNVWGYTGDAYGYSYNGKKVHGSYINYGASYTTNDIIGIFVDYDVGKIWFAKNNVVQGGGDPVAGTGEAFSGISGTYFPGVSVQGNVDAAVEARFTVGDQTYEPLTGFSAAGDTPSPFIANSSFTVSEIYAGYVDLDEAFSAVASISGVNIQQEITAGTFSAAVSGQANIQVELSAGAFSAVAGFSCDHCFNYAQIAAEAPTPRCKMSAVFRYARIDAEAPTPTASFRVGKRIGGDCPTPEFTCTAYHGRNPSIVASAPVPSCSMRVGLSLKVEAGGPVPTCSMTADTHHLATIYGNVPTPTCEIVAATENIAIISASAPCPRGKFTTTVGNVADIYGKVPCPTGSMRALTGVVVSLSGRVPVPGRLVRFHASLLNVSITLGGDVPVPTMTSTVNCSMPSLVLRHERGEVR